MENMNINLLDLGDDILNIIGDYVKKIICDHFSISAFNVDMYFFTRG